MDLNASEFLKDAIYETDSDIRLHKLSRACKKISSSLPFDNKNKLLILQKDLFKHMFLAYPLFKESVIIYGFNIKLYFVCIIHIIYIT